MNPLEKNTREASEIRIETRVDNPSFTDVPLLTRTSYIPAVILLSLFLQACPRLISLNYEPSNPYTATGKIEVGTFEYAAATKRLVRPKEIESNPKGVGTFFTSQDINILFSNALKSELTFSGFAVEPEQEVVVFGVIERFYFDWVTTGYKTFELEVRFMIRSGSRLVYSQTSRSTQTRPKSIVSVSPLIKAALKECIQEFMGRAQEAHVL